MEQNPNPHSTPVTTESVAKLDPKIQEILLRNANKAKREQEAVPVASAPEAQEPKQPILKQAQFTTFIEKSLPKED